MPDSLAGPESSVAPRPQVFDLINLQSHYDTVGWTPSALSRGVAYGEGCLVPQMAGDACVQRPRAYRVRGVRRAFPRGVLRHPGRGLFQLRLAAASARATERGRRRPGE